MILSPLYIRRAARGMTQAELAGASHVALRTIRNIERGHTKAGHLTDTIERLAAALGCAPADLLARSDVPHGTGNALPHAEKRM